jgi:hypothetical protein
VVDYAYGTDGRVALPLSVVAILPAPGGGVYVAGTLTEQKQSDFGVVRLTAAGTPDPAFGVNGLARVPFDLLDPTLFGRPGNETVRAAGVLPASCRTAG